MKTVHVYSLIAMALSAKTVPTKDYAVRKV